jgi:hypothetical protein
MARPSTSRPDASDLGGRYSLQEPIGTGGMASVWLARDTRLDRDVAVKLLSEGLAADPAFAARFRREARIAASLRHPNLVGVYDFDPEGPRPYLVMEFVPGPNLADRLARGDQVPVERLAGDLLSALEAIHRVGVVHRDVKPQNVLLAPGGRAMLTDFGIARPQDATSITQTGQMPGTARYMAPELLEGEQATPASDLYSCGVVLRDCLGDEAGHGTVRELAEALSQPDPLERPPSASAALAGLLRPRAPLELPDAPAAPPPRRPEARTIRIERSRLIAAALGAAGALIALVIALSGGGGDEAPGGRDALAGAAGERSGGGGGPGPSESSGTGDAAEEEGGETAIPAPSPTPDPGRGAALDQEGRSLIDAGRPEQAVGVLRRAVASFPAGTGDLNYAYALFNLGQALRLAGRPEDAIPVLRRRLEIPNQTETVQAELDAAIAATE